jgi:hypothetical protein
MSITVEECIRRVKTEIVRTHAFASSLGKRERLEELEAMLKDYEKQQAEGVTEL